MFVDPTIGNITIFAGNFAPMSYMFCDGTLLPISNYNALFAIIGTTYGGNGVTTFALPDMRNRVVVHAGQGPGLSLYVEGETGGNSSITLNSSNLPMHNHTFISFSAQMPVSTATATQNSPLGAVPAAFASGNNIYNTNASGVMGVSNNNTMTVLSGGSGPVSLQSPYLAMYYIIAVEGIFPSRN